ncbi:hypothetical protein MBLNU230_g8192t1 [Neophaeotheca triangularis]
MVPKSKSKIPNAVNEFTVVPLQLPTSPSVSRPSTHYLYLRANAPKIPTEDTPREVFAVNVPIDSTEHHFRSLFAENLGGARIENVAFESARVGKGISAPVAPAKKGKKRKRGAEDDTTSEAPEVGLLPETWDREVHRSGSTAVVTFIDTASAELALREARKAAKTGRKIPWAGESVDSRVPPLGLARYKAHHALRYPSHAALQSSVDAYMTAFAAREAARSKQLARQRSEPDEDGFITVTRGGRAGPGREEEAKAKEAEFRKRAEKRLMPDFYRFQVREKKKDEARSLVRGFEEDRRKVEEMRKRRGKMRPE